MTALQLSVRQRVALFVLLPCKSRGGLLLRWLLLLWQAHHVRRDVDVQVVYLGPEAQ